MHQDGQPVGAYRSNPWIQFLRKYGPIPRNDNMYDESIQRSLRRSGAVGIQFAVPFLDELVTNFRGSDPHSTILTGTAGDGKTYLCRKVWETLGGEASVWEADQNIRRIELPSGQTLVVIKDLSELKAEDRSILVQMAEAIAGLHRETVFLLAANDGQLVEAFVSLPDGTSIEGARRVIEELLVGGKTTCEGARLLLFHLSRTSAATLFAVILDAIIHHPGWHDCEGCLGLSEEVHYRCPIRENYERVQAPLFRQRLRALLELCDHNDYHLPIRQLLLIIANTLLGHPNGKDCLLRCSDCARLAQEHLAEFASPYQNLFGMNLPETRRESVEAFDVLGRFSIGEEASTSLDNVLIFGNDDENFRDHFDALIKTDTYYGATPRYLALQAAYLEGQDQEASEAFVGALAAQRQRLFFTLPHEYINSMRLWNLTVFRYAGEYLNEVVAQLRGGHAAPRHVTARIVRGMNRVFSGMLTTTDRSLVLATSGSYSQARVSRIEEVVLSVEPKRGERVTLELVEGRLVCSVYLDRDWPPVRLPLHLVRYEFLSRVAEGALPSSFSKECYEDLLAFKSRLLREYRKVAERYGDQPGDGQLHLKLLQLDTRGAMSSRALEVRLS